MTKVRRLIKSFEQFISLPWRSALAPAQRVVFCVYNETDELVIRAKLDEFEIVTKAAGHEWAVYDVTNSFAEWMSSQKYAQKYFEKPELLPAILPGLLEFIKGRVTRQITEQSVGHNHVFALYGTGALFGFIKIRHLVDEIAPLINGRLLVFYPGSYENNNYRLLDGYDGWNYLAVPITSDTTY